MTLLARLLGLATVLLTVAAFLVVSPAHAAANPKPNIDFNSDNRADIAFVGDGNCLYFMHGRGNGTFYSPHKVGCGWLEFARQFAAPGDINRDRKADLVAVSAADDCLYRWRGNGNNTFAAKEKIGCGWVPISGSPVRATSTGTPIRISWRSILMRDAFTVGTAMGAAAFATAQGSAADGILTVTR